jgi:plastocyanin
MWHGLRKGTLVAALILFNALLAGCGGAPGGVNNQDGTTGNTTQPADGVAAPNPAPVQIVIDNFTFKPAELTIPAGTKVTWVNHDDVPHTATSTAKPRQFDSGTLDTDEQFSHVFTDAGGYDYFCALHKHMKARITVK